MGHRVLVPFELPDAEPVPRAVAAILGATDVVVLGHFGLPEQTPPSAGRDQFEAEASEELAALAADFEAAGASVTSRLVFGKDRARTIDRVAVEEDCDVVLTPGEADRVERVLVPLRGEDNLDRIASFVAELSEASDPSITLFHAVQEDDRRPGEELLADAADALTAAGVDPDRVERRLSEGGDPRSDILDTGTGFDAIVLGESEPSLRERIFGDLLAGVTADTADPTFVIRNRENVESLPDE